MVKNGVPAGNPGAAGFFFEFRGMGAAGRPLAMAQHSRGLTGGIASPVIHPCPGGGDRTVGMQGALPRQHTPPLNRHPNTRGLMMNQHSARSCEVISHLILEKT